LLDDIFNFFTTKNKPKLFNNPYLNVVLDVFILDMKSIILTGVTGTPPYVISICDVNQNNCYEVFNGTPTLPLYLEIPSQLSTANQVLLDVVDSLTCDYFQIMTCITPSPTPTTTNTPTPTQTTTPTPTPTQTMT
jgi:hypothetical protein